MSERVATPGEAMLQPIHRVVRFMITLDAKQLKEAFVPQPVIVENFAPYVFRGRAGLAAWRKGFRAHASTLSELKPRFGVPQDFSRTGNKAYFVLPTTWTGRSNGKAFEEEGGWSFVLAARGSEWRVAAYAWSVTALRAL